MSVDKSNNPGIPIRPSEGSKLNVSIGPNGKPIITSDDLVNIDNIKVKSIGIENVLDLSSINMSKSDGRTMIIGCFKERGSFEICYTDAGKLEALNCNDTTTRMSSDDPDGIVILIAQMGQT